MSRAKPAGPVPDAGDRARVRRSALRVAVWVGAASAAIVGLITVATVSVLFATSRPDGRPPREGGRPPGRVIDLDDVVPVAIALGVLGVLALGVIAWFAAARAARPLAEALAVQRAFVADASHELRTPLTTLTSRIQLAEHRAERGGDVAGALADLRRDAAAMDGVLTDLLLSAESAASGGADRDAAADVAASASATVAVVGPGAAERGVTLRVESPEGLVAAAEPAALTRALIALADNAVRYSPAGGTVLVTARSAPGRVEVRVCDEGPGITGIPMDRLFDRFARADGGTEGGGRRGFGLGLALVRDIATRSGGSVEVERTSSAGTVFLLTLPLRRGRA
ncbi:sensor histidine kinase [Microbacterium aureliae]